jgi:hypothetical protein
MNQLRERCLEDFAVGQTFGSGAPAHRRGPGRRIRGRARSAPLQLAEAAARRSIFDGLTASGWRWSMHMVSSDDGPAQSPLDNVII